MSGKKTGIYHAFYRLLVDGKRERFPLRIIW